MAARVPATQALPENTVFTNSLLFGGPLVCAYDHTFTFIKTFFHGGQNARFCGGRLVKVVPRRLFLASLNSVSVIHFACAFCCNLLFYFILFSFEYGPEEGFSAQALIRRGYPSHFNLLYRPSPTIAAVGAGKENWFSGPVLEGGGKLLREVSAPRPDLGGQPVHFFRKSCGANSASRARDFDRVLMFAVLPRV